MCACNKMGTSEQVSQFNDVLKQNLSKKGIEIALVGCR